MNRISTIQGHGQPGCRRADRGGAAADSMAALLKRVFIFIALMLTTASGAWADNFSADAYTANATLNAVSVSTDQTVTINEGVTVTVNNGLSIQSNATLTVTGGGTLVVNGTTGANGDNGWGDVIDGYHNPTAGGNGGAAITINGSAQLALSNATVIANGGQGGQGGQGQNGPDVFWAASGANGNGFSSFPTIEGAVLSYSTNGTDYTEYAPDNSTLYRYMKAEAAALQPYYVTLAEGTEDADKWTVKVGEGAFTVLPVEGIEEGKTVTIQYNGTRRIKSVTAVMVPVLVSGITLNKTTVELKAGETTTLNVTAVTPEKATDKTYTWSSSNEAAATVSQNGVVTAKTVTADTTVNITATANDGSGVKATCVVTVKPQKVDNNGFTIGGWNEQPGGNLGTE